MAPLTSLAPAAATGAADWIVAALRDFAKSVLSLVPGGFSAYVRVFHPAYRGAWPEQTPVRWAEIAAASEKRCHPGMQLPALTGSVEALHRSQPGVFDQPPRAGSLPPELAGSEKLVQFPLKVTRGSVSSKVTVVAPREYRTSPKSAGVPPSQCCSNVAWKLSRSPSSMN